MDKYIAENKIKKAEDKIKDFTKQGSITEVSAEKPPKQTGKSEAELIKDIMDMFKGL